MEAETQGSHLNLETRIRRSKGRSGRTISATAKVTRDEQKEMEAAAMQRGQSLSEWCREVLLAAARGETITPITNPVHATEQLVRGATPRAARTAI